MKKSNFTSADLSPFARKCMKLWVAQGFKRGVRPGTKEFDRTVKNLNRLKDKKVFRYIQGDKRTFAKEIEFLSEIPTISVGHFSKSLENYLLALKPEYRPTNKKFLKTIPLGKFIASPVFLKNYFGHSPFLHFLKSPPLPIDTIYRKKDDFPTATKIISDYYSKQLTGRKISTSETNLIISNIGKLHQYFTEHCVSLNEESFAATITDTIDMYYNGKFKLFMLGSDIFMDKYKEWLKTGGYLKNEIQRPVVQKTKTKTLYVCPTPLEDRFIYPEIYTPLPNYAEIL